MAALGLSTKGGRPRALHQLERKARCGGSDGLRNALNESRNSKKKARSQTAWLFYGVSAGSFTYQVIEALLAKDDRPGTDM